MGRTQVRQVILQCRVCGNVFFIWRKRSRLRARGHIKHLYCYVCKVDTAHFEIKEDSMKELVVLH